MRNTIGASALRLERPGSDDPAGEVAGIDCAGCGTPAGQSCVEDCGELDDWDEYEDENPEAEDEDDDLADAAAGRNACAALEAEARRTRGVPGRLRLLLSGDTGMSTAEYAIGTIAAAAFAALLYTVLTGDNVVNALTSLVQRALSVTF
jgi:hypothetical protein